MGRQLESGRSTNPADRRAWSHEDPAEQFLIGRT
jgi:hypothetical protein